MKSKYNKEDLFHSLPDYITDNISDKNLIEDIEKEIEHNAEFKYEYEDLKNTFLFLSENDLEKPDELYFNNLSVSINNMIEQRTINQSFFQRLNMFWKIFIPAIPVIIIASILFYNLNSKVQENIITNNSIINNSAIEKENEQSDNSTVQKGSFSESKNEQLNGIKNEGIVKKTVNNKRTYSALKINTADNSSDINNNLKVSEETISNSVHSDNQDKSEYIASDFEEDAFISKESDEEIIIEDEMINLTPDEEKEILDNLNKLKI